MTVVHLHCGNVTDGGGRHRRAELLPLTPAATTDVC
jgi:hypothetical protein